MEDLLVTPDYGLSDVWHFNYPLKYLLSESLRSGKFPLWTDLVGNGSPIAAEGQIGAFSPINWIIFGLFPMPFAFMVATLSTFFISAAGSYLFARVLGLSRTMSLVGAAFASINGYAIVQMTHLNLLQSFSFIPWAFFFLERYISSKNRRYLLWLSVMLAQMMLIGYPQTMVNTLVMLLVYSFVRSTRAFLRLMIPIGASVVLALLLSAVQILPLVELARESDTLAIAARQRFVHPLLPRHLLNIVHPFLFGDPSRGTYDFRGPGQPRFWESLLYIGFIPLLILIVVIINTLIRRGQMKYVKMSGIIAITVLSFTLALGNVTPLRYLFKIFPLSATRVESRFLVFTHFGLAMLAAIALSRLRFFLKHRGFIVAAAALHVAQVLWVFRSYHLFDKGERWMVPPEVTRELPPSARIVTLHQEDVWNAFSPDTHGWIGEQNELVAARSTLGANSNIIFGVRQLGVYAQQYPRRQKLIQLNMYGDDVLGKHIREEFGVTHLLNAKSGEVRVVPTDLSVSDISIPSVITHVSGPEEALGRMAQESFKPGVEALWESDRISGDDEQIVVINRSFYPGWSAYLGDQKTPIYPVNINQQAVVVPKDTALLSLRFIFDPWSYKIGRIVSLVSVGLWIVLFQKFRYNNSHAHRD